MKDIIPFEYEASQIRVIVNGNGDPWWVAKDVCEILEHTNPSVAINMLDDDERAKKSLGRQGETWFINEPGLYTLIIRSNKPGAKKFKRWITHEVLPSIRKTGTYSIPGNQADPPTLIPISKEFKVAVAMAKEAGFKGNQAVLSANRAVERITGYDCLDILGATHLMHEQQDTHMLLFLEEKCVRGYDESVPCTDLFEAYKKWCQESLHRPFGKSKFYGNVLAQWPETKKQKINFGTSRRWGFSGIGLDV